MAARLKPGVTPRAALDASDEYLRSKGYPAESRMAVRQSFPEEQPASKNRIIMTRKTFFTPSSRIFSSYYLILSRFYLKIQARNHFKMWGLIPPRQNPQSEFRDNFLQRKV